MKINGATFDDRLLLLLDSTGFLNSCLTKLTFECSFPSSLNDFPH